MRGYTTSRGENSFGGDHTAQVLRRRFDPGQHDFLSFIRTRDCLLCAENHVAGRSTRSRRQAAPDFLSLADGLPIENRSEQMRERIGGNPFHRVLLRDQFFLHHVHGNTDGCVSCSFAVSRLQNVKAIVLDGEFEVLHVLEMLFEGRPYSHQCFVRGRHFPSQISDGMRRAHSGDHVFALCVDQVLAVKNLFATGGVACESDTGGARLTHVAKNHCLDIDRRAPVMWDSVLPPVNNRTIIHPGTEYCADRAPELLLRVLREGPLSALFN